MKKLLFILPLLFLFIIPNKIFALENEEYRYILQESGLSSSQKAEYLDKIHSTSIFQSYSPLYNNYIIVYQDKDLYPFLNDKEDCIVVMFMPDDINFFLDLDTSGSYPYPRSLTTHASYSLFQYYYYDLEDETLSAFDFSWDSQLNLIGINNVSTTDTYENDKHINWRVFNFDYVLETNIFYSFDTDIDIYDQELNHLFTIYSGENVFDFSNLWKNFKGDYFLDDIFNADDLIYSISQKIVGRLPEEFSFVYSIVSLGIAILLVIVILSPFIILKLLLGR